MLCAVSAKIVCQQSPVNGMGIPINVIKVVARRPQEAGAIIA